MKKLRALWASTWGDVDRRVRLGKLLGLAFIAIGFLTIAKAWDGAASKLSLPEMFPYLLSGGFLGLGLVITGGVMLFLATLRAERQILTDRYEEMATLLSRNLSRLAISANGSSGETEQVVAGSTAYHRAGCRVLQGKENLMTIPVEQAVAEGLAACRVCEPPVLPEKQEETAAAETQAAGVEATSGSASEPTPESTPATTGETTTS